MKNLLYLFIAVLAFLGCNKNTDPDLIFGSLPEERVAERNAELRNKLTSSPHGWVASLPALAGGFGFFMQFNADETVKMMGDLSDASATEPLTSTYRIKYVMNTSLIFDTYNYLTLLQDPSPEVAGGIPAQGYQSDIEFEYIRSTEDSIILKGKRYRNNLYLVKATADQKVAYEQGKLLEKMYDVSDYFDENTFGYIELLGLANKVMFDVNQDKSVTLLYVNEKDSIIESTAKFNYDLDGLHFTSGLSLNGIDFTNAVLKDDVINLIDKAKKSYKLEPSAAPVVPLYKLLGTKFSGIEAKFKTIYPGTSASGAQIVAHYVNNLDNRYTGYVFGNGTMTLLFDIQNKRLTIEGWHNQNGNGGWITTAVYNYEATADGTYTFTSRSAPSGGYVATLIKETGKPTIDNFLLNNQVKFDYYIDNGTLYAKMYSLNRPDIVMTFILV